MTPPPPPPRPRPPYGRDQHWHGIFQHSHAYVDGLAFVNQCPIAPNDTFLYEFTAVGQTGMCVRLPPKAALRTRRPRLNLGFCTGTFWYHSHYMTQYCDGLRGPFVIYDPQDPYLSWYDIDDGERAGLRSAMCLICSDRARAWAVGVCREHDHHTRGLAAHRRTLGGPVPVSLDR